MAPRDKTACQTFPCKCKICISSIESDVYNKKKIQMFVVNMTFISSREVKKCIFHSCLRHSWNIHFFTSLDEIKVIFTPNIWISSIYELDPYSLQHSLMFIKLFWRLYIWSWGQEAMLETIEVKFTGSSSHVGDYVGQVHMIIKPCWRLYRSSSYDHEAMLETKQVKFIWSWGHVGD